MSIISSSAHSTDSGFYDFSIEQSLRFDGGYLSRTPSSASNQKTWTWSGWVKKSKLDARQAFFSSSSGSGLDDNNHLQFGFQNDNTLQLGLYTEYVLVTNQVFQDLSAWYHFVISFDTQ